MDMQDKEFDNLFRSKLEDFEAEPTSQVWEGVAEGLHGKRRYRVMASYLSIAASIIVLLAAAILFIPQKTNTSVKHPVKNNIAKTTTPAIVIKPDTLTTQRQRGIQQPAPTAVNKIARTKPAKIINVRRPAHSEPVLSSVDAVKPQEQPVLAAVQQKQEAVKPVVPDSNTPLVTRPTVEETPAFITKPELIAHTLPANKKQDGAVVKTKHKAHGLGGLLNVVIAAVDKRKDKIIEFSDADDEETNVMSINLGILKSKRERQANRESEELRGDSKK
jgi:hypothetical protein